VSDPVIKFAAAVLAEATIQGRKLRAEKRADALSDALAWAGKAENAPVTGALAGAAAGGLGGMALGATGKRKRNPFASGLTGALAGGATGVGLGLGYRAMQSGALPPGLEEAKAKVDATEAAKTPTLGRIYNKARSYIVDTPEAENETWAGIAGGAARRAGSGSGASGFENGLGAAGGAGLAAHGYFKDQARDSNRRFAAGAETLLPTPTKPVDVNKVGPKVEASVKRLQGTYNMAVDPEYQRNPFVLRDLIGTRREGSPIHDRAMSAGYEAVPNRPWLPFGGGGKKDAPKMTSHLTRGGLRFAAGAMLPTAIHGAWDFGKGLLNDPAATGGQQ
jgi:hypothetical protein